VFLDLLLSVLFRNAGTCKLWHCRLLNKKLPDQNIPEQNQGKTEILMPDKQSHIYVKMHRPCFTEGFR